MIESFDYENDYGEKESLEDPGFKKIILEIPIFVTSSFFVRSGKDVWWAVEGKKQAGRYFKIFRHVVQKYKSISETSPQAKRHKPSLLFTSLTILTSPTFITSYLLSLNNFYH